MHSPTYLRICRISNPVTMMVNGLNTWKLASMTMSGLDTTNITFGLVSDEDSRWTAMYIHTYARRWVSVRMGAEEGETLS